MIMFEKISMVQRPLGGNEQAGARLSTRNTGTEPIQLAVSKSSGSPASTRGTRLPAPGARKEQASIQLAHPPGLDLAVAPERSPFLQALIDVSAVAAAFLVVSSVALSIPLAFFMMFFASF